MADEEEMTEFESDLAGYEKLAKLNPKRMMLCSEFVRTMHKFEAHFTGYMEQVIGELRDQGLVDGIRPFMETTRLAVTAQAKLVEVLCVTAGWRNENGFTESVPPEIKTLYEMTVQQVVAWRQQHEALLVRVAEMEAQDQEEEDEGNEDEEEGEPAVDGEKEPEPGAQP